MTSNDALVHVIHWLINEACQLDSNCRSVQERCTELLLENRRLRAENAGLAMAKCAAERERDTATREVLEYGALQESKIVAWMRSVGGVGDLLADQIERGEHEK